MNRSVIFLLRSATLICILGWLSPLQAALPNELMVQVIAFRDCADCPDMVRLPDMNIAMGKYEVTQAQWRNVMDNNPSYFSLCGDDCPVEQVSWDDVQVFINRLNQRTGQRYRLPTETEWEKACLAGESTRYCGSNNVDDVAWSIRNSRNITHAVGQKHPNAWGLYDMSGNVWEWTNTGDDNQHVLRGGSWINKPKDVRVQIRDVSKSDYRYNYVLGFRLARNP